MAMEGWSRVDKGRLRGGGEEEKMRGESGGDTYRRSGGIHMFLFPLPSMRCWTTTSVASDTWAFASLDTWAFASSLDTWAFASSLDTWPFASFGILKILQIMTKIVPASNCEALYSRFSQTVHAILQDIIFFSLHIN